MVPSMKKLTQQRRKVVLFSSCAAICAATPVLLGDQLHGNLHHFVFGLGTGLAIPLLIAAAVLQTRREARSEL
jgi:cyanate permease